MRPPIGTLQGGCLGRWFEELCRIDKKHIGCIMRPGHPRTLDRGRLPAEGGVYAFWWTGDTGRLRDRKREIVRAGPGGSPVRLRLDDEWLGLSTGLPIPLYVGKTTDIRSRVSQHLRLRCNRGLQQAAGNGQQKPATTACQLRAGIDRLFPRVKDTRNLILKCVGLSYVELDGPEYAANRFYLECMAIGQLRPPFNVDVER